MYIMVLITVSHGKMLELKSITFNGYGIHGAVVETLASVLPGLTKLTNLALLGMDVVTDSDAALLIESLHQTSTLTSLSLS